MVHHVIEEGFFRLLLREAADLAFLEDLELLLELCCHFSRVLWLQLNPVIEDVVEDNLLLNHSTDLELEMLLSDWQVRAFDLDLEAGLAENLFD